MKSVLVTGDMGFIGFFLSNKLLNLGWKVVGVDNSSNYYDTSLKTNRLNKNKKYTGYMHYDVDITNFTDLEAVFKKNEIDIVIHLAAQAGVRYSIINPMAYISTNILGFYNVLLLSNEWQTKHFIYASSSSVYGSSKVTPFTETDFVDAPVSLYAATKKTDELIAYTYSKIYGLPTTGLRFFTVYGPYGRPDMAYFSFLDTYFANEPITIYNNGDYEHDLLRDFTYIDDIVEGIVNLIDKVPSGPVPYEIYNIGNNQPVKLMDFIATLESCLSKSLGRPVQFEKRYEPMKPGDVPATYANTDKLYQAIGFKPNTPLEVGLQKFTDWYVEYYNKK